MKKKIKDLTDEESKKLCDKHHHKYIGCCNCPLEINDFTCFRDIDLDREIEVEEDE